MEEFLAYRIIDGKLTYKKVPASLKAEVACVLRECGCGDLVVE